MKFCRLFIDRPVATTLMSFAIFAAGVVCYPLLPVATMPDMTPTAIMVVASQPGADPQQMATSVTAPLERRLASIADIQTIESDTASSQASIFLNFSSSRDINGALRDVQAALRAARADLPKGTLDSDPQAFKLDGSGFPAYLLSIISDQMTSAQLYDLASVRIRPLLAQVKGVGRVEDVGAATPSVRVELNPYPLYKWGIGLEDIRTALASANAFTPKGFIDSNGQRMSLSTNDQAINAAQYRNLVIGYRDNFYPVRLSDVATVTDSTQDVYQANLINGHRAVTLIVTAQPHANTVAIVDGINARFDRLRALVPAQARLVTGIDTSRTIRAALADAKLTLVMSVFLVMLVILLFFRRLTTTIIPAVTVPIALSGTLAAMSALHFTLDVLSLMSLTIAVGFVVDDAIVVLENIARHVEDGMPRYEASVVGASEITFTVVSITASLIAVFIPLLFLPNPAGSIMFEFCMTMICAIAISMWLSLTLTPMMCARFLQVDHGTDTARPPLTARITRVIEGALDAIVRVYDRSMTWCLRHPVLTGLSLPLSIIVLIGSIIVMPKEFVPQQDLSLLQANIRNDATMSFDELIRRTGTISAIIQHDPDVKTVTAFNDDRVSAQLFIGLRDKSERANASSVVDRLRKSIPVMPGTTIALWSVGGSQQGGNSQRNTGSYRYVLRSEQASDLYEYMPRLLSALRASGKLVNVSSTIEQLTVADNIRVQRDTEARYGITPQLIQNILYDSYGQAIVSTIHLPSTDHRVVMVVAPRYRQNPQDLHRLWISTAAGTAAGGVASNLIRVHTHDPAGSLAALSAASIRNALTNQISGTKSSGSAVSSASETMIPLDNVARILPRVQPLDITHRDGIFSAAISFDLTPGTTYSAAKDLIEQTMKNTFAPTGVHSEFTGTAGNTGKAIGNGLIAIVATIAVMYIVLGILYESLIHPITILSTLPSAGIGAILALWLCGEAFSMIAMIGIILLTGIVKKNAILVIDFAIDTQRTQGLTPREAVHLASVTRFRPILMTSLAAAFGAVPLIMGTGYGCELRRPLGIAVIGGMIVSQLLTLYTTPIVYLWMDAIGKRGQRLTRRLLSVFHHSPRAARPPGQA